MLESVLLDYLCSHTSAWLPHCVSFWFIHLDVLPQSCSKTTSGCTTSCLHLCVLLLAPPPNLPAVSWLAESGLMVEVCMVPLCSLSQHKATVYLTCPHQCSACKLRTPQQAMGHPSNTWDQLHPSLFLWRSSSRPWNMPWSTPWHHSVLTEHKAMDSWKLGLQWKPFWSKRFRPTNCSGDLEELGSIHPDSASSWKREGWKNKLPQKDLGPSTLKQTWTGSQWKTLPAPSYPQHNSTLLNSTNHIWYAIHSKKRSGFSVALKLQCLYPPAPPFTRSLTCLSQQS